MAKSLRSKFKRKIRALARAKKAHKEAAWLQEAVSRRDVYEQEQNARETQAAGVKTGNDELEAMDSSSPDPVRTATINVNTMKRHDGTYPPWISGT
uniref:rRNA-processing protein efg1 n=1 Tax=Angiostrongylus cantonensis TaxID=6313 RepID=A0A0K0D1M7_ANGCA